jgi:hypothetical protein
MGVSKMIYIKRLLLVFLLVNVLVPSVRAGLLEDVDALTPQQAVELEQKLQQKKFEATPERSRMTGFIQLINPTQLGNAFPGVNRIGNLYGWSFDLRTPINDKVLIGGSFSGAGNYAFNQSSPRIYEDMVLGYGSAQLAMDYRFIKSENFILSVTPGVGIILGGYNYTKTDDNAKTFYTTNRWGSGICTSLSLDASWKVYKEWGAGIGISTFSGKLANMRKILSDIDATAPEIDLTGTTFRISGSKYF